MRNSDTNQIHTFTYSGESVRLDQYVKKQFPDISRAYIQDLIVAEGVYVNNLPGKKGTMVRDGDLVRVEAFVHPDDRLIASPSKPSLNIVFENEHYLIIDKAAGMPTHPNEYKDTGCVANHFVGLYPDSIKVGEDALRPGIVHRLDNHTSGLLILAKTQEAFTLFRAKFDQRHIYKTYLALAMGSIVDDHIEIDTPLAHHHKNPRKMVALVDDRVLYRSTPKQSKTMVKVISRFDKVTYVEVRTLTGRMHQVRVHLSSQGHSLVGDRIYQSQKEKTQDKFGLDRHFLHASNLSFEDPWSRKERNFISELPLELKDCLKKA